MKFILLILLNLQVIAGKGQNQYATITGRLHSLKDGDTLTLAVEKYGYSEKDDRFVRYYTPVVKNHNFRLMIPAGPLAVYGTIHLSATNVLYHLNSYIIRAQDKINITDSGTHLKFDGEGAGRYRAIYHLRSIETFYLQKHRPFKIFNMPFNFALYDSVCLKSVTYLNSLTNEITPGDAALLKADVLAMMESQKRFDFLWLAGSKMRDSGNHILLQYQNNCFRQLASQCFINDKVLAQSKYYPRYILDRFTDSCEKAGIPFSVAGCYHYLKSNFSGALRDKLVTFLLMTRRRDNEDYSDCINDAVSYVKNVDFLYKLKQLHHNLAAGATAYPFALPDALGKIRHFKDYEGKVILLDFWFTGCGACRLLAPRLKEIENKYHGQPVVFISISIDRDKELWQQSLRSGLYADPQNINLYTDGMGDGHPVITHYNVAAYPTLILIDPKGKLLKSPANPLVDNGKSLTDLINQCLSENNNVIL